MEENKVEENKIEDKTEKTFKELYLAGEIGFDEIDRYISHWNNSDDERTQAVLQHLKVQDAVLVLGQFQRQENIP